jgi:hypothetical protein
MPKPGWVPRNLLEVHVRRHSFGHSFSLISCGSSISKNVSAVRPLKYGFKVVCNVLLVSKVAKDQRRERGGREAILPVSWSSIHSTRDSMSRLLFAIVASFSGMKDMFLSSMTRAFGERKEGTRLFAAKNHNAFDKEESISHDKPSSGGQISVVLTSYNLNKTAIKNFNS